MCIKVIAASVIWTTITTIQHNPILQILICNYFGTNYSVLFTLLFLYMPCLETLFIESVFQFT